MLGGRFANLGTVLLALVVAAAPAAAINRGHVLQGVVTDLEGQPVAEAKVVLIDEANRRDLDSTLTDDNGAFQMVDLPRGSWLLTVSKSGSGSVSVRVEMLSTLFHTYDQDVQLLSHDRSGADAEVLYLAPGRSVSSRALHAWRQASEARAAGDFETVEKVLREAIQADPTFSRAYTELGIEHHRRGDLSAADELYRKGLELNPGDPVAMVNLAALRLAQQRSEPALELLRKAIEIDPALPRAYLYLGQAHAVAGDAARAIEPLRHAGQLDPAGCSSAFRLLGNAYVRLGSIREARDAYRRYLELAPQAADAALVRANVDRLESEMDRLGREAAAARENLRPGAGAGENEP